MELKYNLEIIRETSLSNTHQLELFSMFHLILKSFGLESSTLSYCYSLTFLLVDPPTRRGNTPSLTNRTMKAEKKALPHFK